MKKLMKRSGLFGGLIAIGLVLFLGFQNFSHLYSPNQRLSYSTRGTPLTSFGFAESFIIGMARHNGWQCPKWWGTEFSQCNNQPPMSPYVAESYLAALAQKGVKVHKETISVAFLMDPSGPMHLARALELYQRYDFKVILELSFPIPGNPNGLACFPQDDQKFESFIYEKLANPMANAFKQVLYGPSSRRMNPYWFQNNVIVTPWGEFDNIGALNADGTDCIKDEKGEPILFMTGSPRKAASMHAIFRYVFWLNHLGNEITTPSFVNAYGGELIPTPRDIKFDKARVYLANYYAAAAKLNSDGGRPNIHLYYGSDIQRSDSAVKLVGAYESGIQMIASSIPEQFRGRMIIAETGFADYVEKYCEPHMGGVPWAVRDDAYSIFTASETVRKEVDLLTFWRLFNLHQNPSADKPHENCEAQFGVVHAGEWEEGFKGDYNQHFKEPGLRVFTGIGLNRTNK